MARGDVGKKGKSYLLLHTFLDAVHLLKDITSLLLNVSLVATNLGQLVQQLSPSLRCGTILSTGKLVLHDCLMHISHR